MQFQHHRMIELKEGILSEVLVLKETDSGDIYFIDVNSLCTKYDTPRFSELLTRTRNADSTPLYDLMGDKILPNGMSMLELYNPLVQVRYANGIIGRPSLGTVGAVKTNKGGRPPKAK